MCSSDSSVNARLVLVDLALVDRDGDARLHRQVRQLRLNHRLLQRLVDIRLTVFQELLLGVLREMKAFLGREVRVLGLVDDALGVECLQVVLLEEVHVLGEILVLGDDFHFDFGDYFGDFFVFDDI